VEKVSKGEETPYSAAFKVLNDLEP